MVRSFALARKSSVRYCGRSYTSIMLEIINGLLFSVDDGVDDDDGEAAARQKTNIIKLHLHYRS
jgi:hypothetical protein